MISENKVKQGKSGKFYTLTKNGNYRYVTKALCAQCNKSTYVDSAKLGKYKHFCSYKCRKKFFPVNGELNPMWGKRHVAETRKRMSLERRLDKNSNWKGGRSYQSGYIMVRQKGKAVREHKLIVENVLGRKLRSNEIIHHINMDKADNRKCNLLVCDKSYHVWLHHEMARRWVFDAGL